MQTCIKESRGCWGMHAVLFCICCHAARRNGKKTIMRNFITAQIDICSNRPLAVCMLLFRASTNIIRVPVVAKCLRKCTFAFIWTWMWGCVCARLRVCECQYCARITPERIRGPHFQFRSISARISVIPLKSCSSPTVTSHNGANTRVVGTQLRLPGSIRRTFPIPQPVCMQTEPPQRRTLIWQPFTEPCVDIFNASITTA